MTYMLAILMTLTAIAAPASEPTGEQLATAADWHARNKPRLQRNDCSGLIESVYRRAGVVFTGSTKSYWEEARRRGVTHMDPKPGDLVFFDNTFDKNGNGRIDDPLTHIAMVTNVLSDGTIVMVHRGGQGILEIRANLDRPDVHVKGDQVYNDFLRRADGNPNTPRLAGEMIRGFATMYGPEPGGSSEGTSDREPAPRTPPKHQPKSEPRPSKERPVADGPDFYGDKPFKRARRGRKVKRKHLKELDCGELWAIRNTAYARHGYTFRGQRAQVFFDGLDWYERNPAVNYDTIGNELTRRDEKNMRRVVRREKKTDCR